MVDLYVMGPRTGAVCHGDWSQFSSESLLDSYPRSEEPSTQSPSPSDAVQQTSKKANLRKVHPEPPPPPTSSNEDGNAQEVQFQGSNPPEDGAAQWTSEASARDRNSNTDVADNHVTEQRITHDGSCKIDILKQRKPLLRFEDDEFLKETDCSFSWRRALESFRRVLESFQRLSESLRRVSEFLLNPSPNFFYGLLVPVDFFAKRNGLRAKATGKSLESLPGGFHKRLFQRFQLKELTQSKAVSKSFKDLFQRDFSMCSRASSGENAFTALNFFIKKGEWQCTGYDVLSEKWQRLQTLASLRSPDPNLFQQYIICGHEGLMCAHLVEELVVFNILTGKKKELPPLKYERNPVLLHIWVDSVTDSYKVIAAGSASSSGEKNLSRKIEVYDSRTSEWELGSDIPGPEFGLNEHQAGVCVNGVLYFLMFLDGENGQKGIVAFDIEEGKWLKNMTCALPFSFFCNTLQLLESYGMLYVFSEQERDGVVEHCIDVVERCENSDELWQLRTVVRATKLDGRGLLVYPEYTCVPFGIGKLCIFNTITREGVVYDLDNGMKLRDLEAPPKDQTGENFFCLNPVSFTLAPNCDSKP